LIAEDISSLQKLQNSDGGWGWYASAQSDPYISAYVLYGLQRAEQTGYTIDQDLLDNAVKYVAAHLPSPAVDNGNWEFDRLVFMLYALDGSGNVVITPHDLLASTDYMDPWAKALLAVMLESNNSADPDAKRLLSDLEATALRSSTGVHWQDTQTSWQNFSSPNLNTAVVIDAIARLDPASTLLPDAVRYLVSARNNNSWNSSYENAWALTALTEAMQATGDVQAAYTFAASLNDAPLLSGKAEGLGSLKPVETSVPLASLQPGNALKIVRDAGPGRLYYQVYLTLYQPADTAQAIEQGMSLSRRYTLFGQDCTQQDCPSLKAVQLGTPSPVVLVHLTLTLATDMHRVVVRDTIPAGAEVVNLTLKTTQQGIQPGDLIDPVDPFGAGFGWWWFSQPQVLDDGVQWFADTLPAGTYELTYKMLPLQVGEYRVVPAHAWEYYFPETQATSTGGLFKIEPQ
jgi:hypothetical protein